jgi:hypothetical protein
MTMAVNSWNSKPPSALALQAAKTFSMHPQAARAWHDLFAALGVKPLEEYEGGAQYHPVDIANMMERIDGEKGGMKLLVYATQLQALDRPALRTNGAVPVSQRSCTRYRNSIIAPCCEWRSTATRGTSTVPA